MLRRAPLYLAAVYSLTLAAPAGAQHAETARIVHRPAPALARVTVAAVPTGGSPTAPAANEAKSPLAAGLLSFLIPGVGSFYAGNSNHGFAHLSIALGAAFISLAQCGQGHDAPCGGASDAAALISLVNWPWSIVTAVRDARATKDGASRRSQK